ncbi:hypothetical protein GmRootV59_20240 [Variovorax sp. V59]|uniref:Uncharacterized protein n=2 Tax=Variovorax TaxID=34072 RepID=A0AAE4BXL8_VARPD|nr:MULTISPECIES: hypothetical protein [Variovorax]MBD9663156.1 hypothetical protein [Variovorax sp. VRV01]MDP9963051.1 hypothetical protein [Variovorax paradoxus]MDR6428161.1 hypothetical protein [Variovorax paradoxus]MDR6454190.1 hypothetical protein [Variovorax paradoxus]TWD86125.1 hypothetical protein FB547_10467 [Variovorax beijingensis]
MSPSRSKEGRAPRLVRPAPSRRVPATPKSEGPVATPKVNEGASLGKSANSSAGGAAGQLTPKD